MGRILLVAAVAAVLGLAGGAAGLLWLQGERPAPAPTVVVPLDRARSEALARLRAEVARLTAERDELAAAAEAARAAQAEAAEAARVERVDDLAALRGELKAARVALAARLAELGEARQALQAVPDLRADLQAARQRAETLAEALATARQEVEALELRVQMLGEARDTLARRLDSRPPPSPPAAVPPSATRQAMDAAVRAYEAGDYARAATLWRSLAEAGNARASFHLGALYWEGRGVESDLRRAWVWLRRAADGGYTPAEALLEDLESEMSPAQREAARALLEADG